MSAPIMESKLKYEKQEKPKLAKHDASILDLAFVMDCTGSMGSYIQNAQQSIRDIVEKIVTTERSNVRLALVEYRDHAPQELSFVTRTHDFTSSVRTMKEWLDECRAEGGGDEPEAVADGLNDALNLTWRHEATKICLLISDAPPHGLGTCGDTFQDGCPLGHDPLKIARQMVEKGITLYCVGCEPALVRYRDFFIALAYMTGGQYVPLCNADLLAKVIIGSAQEEISLERLMSDIQAEVNRLVETSGGEMSAESMSKQVHTRLTTQGVQVKKMQMFDADHAKPSTTSKMYSGMSSLSEVREKFKVNEPSPFTFCAPTATTSYTSGDLAAHLPVSFLSIDKTPSASLLSSTVPFSTSVTSRKEEQYSVEEEIVIDEEQTERLVQKALGRFKKT